MELHEELEAHLDWSFGLSMIWTQFMQYNYSGLLGYLRFLVLPQHLQSLLLGYLLLGYLHTYWTNDQYGVRMEQNAHLTTQVIFPAARRDPMVHSGTSSPQ